MRTRTLGSLRADAYARAQLDSAAGSPYPSNADVNEYLNQGWARIYGLLTETGENHYLTTATFTTTAGQSTYYTSSATGVPAGTAVLPTDLYRVKGIDVQVQGATGQWYPCERYEFERRDDNPPGTQPPSAQTFRILYYPAAVRMVSDSDTIDGGNGWEIFAVDWAARRMAERDENYELAARLDTALAEMAASITREAGNRNAGQPKKIRRVRYRSHYAGMGIPSSYPTWPNQAPRYDYQGSGASAALSFVWGYQL